MLNIGRVPISILHDSNCLLLLVNEKKNKESLIANK